MVSANETEPWELVPKVGNRLLFSYLLIISTWQQDYISIKGRGALSFGEIIGPLTKAKSGILNNNYF